MTKNKRIILYIEEKKFIQWCIEKHPPFMKDTLIKEHILEDIYKHSMFQVKTTDLVDHYEDWLYEYSPVFLSDVFKFENDNLIEFAIENGLLDMKGFGEKYKIKVVREGTLDYPTEEQLEKGVK